MTPILAVGAIVFDDEGRILLVQRGLPPAEGLWSVPGGRLEPGETHEHAVAREVLEETGLVVEVGPHAGSIEHVGEGYHYEIHDYLARVTGGELKAADDARSAKWVALSELAAMPLTDGLEPIVQRALVLHTAPWSAST